MEQDIDLIEDDKDAEEEEDYGSFFLKPASSPYNIAEKVQQANFDLFNTNIAEQRQSKVTFREQLVTFEPELTDDDVVSIESDRSDTISNDNVAQILEYKTSSYVDAEIYSIVEEEYINEDIEEDSLNSDGSHHDDEEKTYKFRDNYNNNHEGFYERDQDGSLDNVPLIPVDNGNEAHRINVNDNIKVIIDKTNETVRVSSKRESAKPKRCKKKKSLPEIKLPGNHINCRNHCIEKLDSELSMSIKRLELQEKPTMFPPLKLYERKCCNEYQTKQKQNLPCYNGLRSEYGLNLVQLEKRQRTRELARLKQQRRQELLDEYRERKNQQNEEVFRQWLKDISRRKALVQKAMEEGVVETREHFGPKVITFKPRRQEEAQPRPRTANGFPSERAVKKKTARPLTSDSYFYIQVPNNALARGINLNSLLGTARDLSCKRLHILTFS